MKQFFTVLSLLLVLFTFSQPVSQRSSSSTTAADGRLMANLNLFIPKYVDTTAANLQKGVDTCGAIIFTYTGNKIWKRSCNPKRWEDIANGLLSISDSNTKYTTPYYVAQNYVAIQTQAPTSTLTGGFSYERQPTGNYTVTLDWTAGRQSATPSASATATLFTIVVDGVSQTFAQPAAGASVSGTKSVTFAKNTNITYANSVTTSDGKSAVSYTSFTVYDKRYIGWAASPTPTDIEILFAVNSDNNGGTVPYSATFPQLSGGALYLFYANTATVSSVSVNGFPSTDAFNLNVSRSFVNGVGGTTTYLVTTSKNAIGATSSTSLTIN